MILSRFTEQDWEDALDLARSLGTCELATAYDRERVQANGHAGDRPGDRFEAATDWRGLLEPAGWVWLYYREGLDYWRRPGKTDPGSSATTGVRSDCGKDLLYVFSSNARPFEANRSYSKFAVYTLIHFAGDFRASATFLAANGYGAPSEPMGRIVGLNGTNGQIKPPNKLEKVLGHQCRDIERIGHDELLDSNMPPLRWIVDGLIADEGLTLIGGKKKLGKSWLCLQIAQAVAGAYPCLGRSVLTGRVVYICLEDGRRRLKERLEKQKAPHGLDILYVTRFPKLDAGDGLSRLIELMEDEEPRLVIIDTIAAAKTGKVDENAASDMADLGNALRAIAQYYHTAIAATHHHGKAVGGDPGDDLRGSSALAAAADVNLGLYRGEAGYTLKGEGRDIEAVDLAVLFDAHGTWTWQVRPGGNPHNDAQRQEADGAMLGAVRALGEVDASSAASYLGISTERASERLRRLAGENRVIPRILPAEGRGRPKTLFRLPVESCNDEGDC